jgi:hypothetical protein
VKPRHAAALAIVGWYLMAPPVIDENGTPKIDPSVSISQWDHGDQVFSSQSDCDEQRAKLRAIAERHKNWIGPSGSVAAARHRYFLLINLRCIATDDPRLKEK